MEAEAAEVEPPEAEAVEVEPPEEGVPEVEPPEEEPTLKKARLSEPTVLPTRLLLDAFSTTVGWRPGGLNSGQVCAFVDRFPREFRFMAMGRVTLPYCQWDDQKLPYVVMESGEMKLPCPILSTMNALKYLAKNPDKWPFLKRCGR